MNAQIKIFNNSQFGEIRTATNEQGEPLFCLVDICRVLGLQTNKVKNRLDPKGWCTIPSPTKGGIQNVLFVNEDGLYDVILDSRKPEAKSFRKWVTSEVLPSIRKTGGYIATKEDDTPETIMARALLVAKDTLDRQAEQIKDQRKQYEILSGQLASVIDVMTSVGPKVAYAEAVLQSPSTYTITQVAKELGMSAIALNKVLYSLGIQFKQSGQWVLYSKFQDKGLTATRTFPIYNEKHELTGTRIETVWTEKGRRAIHAKLNSLLKNKQLQESCTN